MHLGIEGSEPENERDGVESCQGRERTHFPMARGNSYVGAVWGGEGRTEGRKGGRKESTQVFLKKKLPNLIIFFTAIFSGSAPTTQLVMKFQ